VGACGTVGPGSSFSSLFSLSVSLCLCGFLSGPVGLAAQPVDFGRDVEPILRASCHPCHSAVAAQADLRLDSRDSAVKGGTSGPALSPGNAADSLLIKRVIGAGGLTRMPMGLPPLSDEQIAALRRWIDAGAPWSAIDFSTQVQPIFTANCVRCHGPDQQKSQLRLDTRTSALRGGLSGRVILPGNAKESLLIRHLLGQEKPRMPFEGGPLPDSQIALIGKWIDSGATGPNDAAPEAKLARHWSYVKPERPQPPGVRNASWIRNPIDAFILARLEKEGLAPSREAPRETLLRRLSLDLIGLPPTLAEIDAFEGDPGPDAYEKAVDRLLASPQYGERWARPWLDLARYADSNGYEKDRLRVAWKYRDWVIDALNKDMSFRDFTIQQIAGDMLKDATIDQRIATGFHRNTLLNQEGGIDVEEARWETLVDRVNTTSSVWLGSTMACAQCHSHKFDPFSQKDYYRMLAFFDNADYRVQGLEETVVDKWIVEPELELPTEEQAARRTQLREEIARLTAILAKSDLTASLQAWERDITAPAPVWTPLDPTRLASVAGSTLEKAPDHTVVAKGDNPAKDTYTLTFGAPLAGVTAFRLEALDDPSLPEKGPGRSSSGNFVLTRFAVATGPKAETPVPLSRGQADFSQNEKTAALAIDSSSETGWAIGAETGRKHVAVFQLKAPLTTPGPLTVTLDHSSGYTQHTLGRFRISVTTSANPWGGLPTPDSIRAILQAPRASRTAEQRKALEAYFRPIAPELDASRDRLATAQRALDSLKITTAAVLGERAGWERPSTVIRQRGSYMSPGERVYAATPAFLPPLPESAPANRLGLALWLVSDENPLTARVAVNRYWEQIFGHGIVETSEDFGSQGERPVHPELLDWLATEFMAGGWSPKKIHRLIVTSATYRQASRVTPELQERDPYNRLLARGPRFRIEAEMVRDVALASANLLSPKMGGPSVFPDQPEGVWNSPYNDAKWVTSEGEDRHRRSLYTFIRRTSPYPSLLTFDAPSREFCTVRRVRTNTPLQALTTLNDPVFVEAARGVAARILAEAGPAPADRAAHGFRICTGRKPEPPEVERLVAFYEREHRRFEGDPGAARALGSSGTNDEAADRAAWTLVANVLLSLDETVTKE
jgi:mono/diheme cytochrome c family protein